MTKLDEAYRIFDLEPGAPDHEVRRAWRDLTKVWHPDRFGNDPALRRRAEEKQKEINEAYETIRAGSGGRSRWPGGSEAAREEESSDGWAVRAGGRVVEADDLATILQWLASGRLRGSEEVYDPDAARWIPLSELPQAAVVLLKRRAGWNRTWAFSLAAVALLLLLRRPSFGMLVIAGALLAISVALLFRWAAAIDAAGKEE